MPICQGYAALQPTFFGGERGLCLARICSKILLFSDLLVVEQNNRDLTDTYHLLKGWPVQLFIKIIGRNQPAKQLIKICQL
jgi:hypothetical protein